MGLSNSQTPFALLQPSEFGVGLIDSDVDIVCSVPADDLVRLATEKWQSVGLQAVAIWEYDVEGTAGVFLANDDATEGVQLDVLHDPRGMGRYRLQTGPLLERSSWKNEIPRISPADELIYLWQKRTSKGQLEQVENLRRRATEIDPGPLLTASTTITGSARAFNQLTGSSQIRRPIRHRQTHGLILDAARRVERLIRPRGFWVHSTSGAVGDNIASRLGRFLRIVNRSELPAGTVAGAISWATKVKSTLLRGGTAVTTGKQGAWWRQPDYVATGADPDRASIGLVHAMNRRVLESVGASTRDRY